jgi:hypothetical protein
MNHFKLRRGDYEYHSAEQGPSIDVGVYYDKGGMSFMTYKQMPRGLYVRISPVERDDVSVRFTLLSGISTFIKPLARKNDKALQALAEQLDAAVPEAVAAWNPKDKRASIAILRRAAGVEVPQ